MEREVVEPVDVAHPDGRLRREAVGWARHPLQRCNLAPGISRAHAFNYWCISDRSCALSVLVADIRVAGFALVSFLDYTARTPVECVTVRPFGLPERLPESPRGDIFFRSRRLELALRAQGDDLHITASGRPLLGRRLEVDVVVERPRTHETVNVVVPWDDTRYHVTSKQQALPARGVVRIGGRERRLVDAYACLDFGRGRWPKGIEWCWAFASGRHGGHTLGLNLCARWTDDTGVTENGVIIDGRLHKIADVVDITPGDFWRIRTRTGDRVDLRFTPIHRRKVRLPLGPVGMSLHQCVGTFSGSVLELPIHDLLGVAETFDGWW